MPGPAESMGSKIVATARRTWGLLLSFLLFPSIAVSGTLVTDQTIEHEGLTRYFDYYIPDTAEFPMAPLLFVLHGGTGDKNKFASGAFSEFFALADGFGFFLVMPNGVDPATGFSGAAGSFNWNDCRSDAGPASTSTDDVGFISGLIDWMVEAFAIDTQRIYSTGASNGGMMSYRLAIELSDRIAATASVVANLPANSECASQPVYPITILIMNGTADPLMPYAGGEIGNGRGIVLSAEAARDDFVDFLGTQTTPQFFQFPDLDSSDAGVGERETYSGGVDGTEVVFFRMNGAGHNIPSIAHPLTPIAELFSGKQNHDIEASVEIWNSLSPVTLPEPRLNLALMIGAGALSGFGRRRRDLIPRRRLLNNSASRPQVLDRPDVLDLMPVFKYDGSRGPEA